MSFLEKILEADLKRARITGWEREFRPDAKRRFRLDFAWPHEMVAIEVDGGQWVDGRHNRGSAADKECERGNFLTTKGWRVLHFTGDMVKRGEVLPVLTTLLDSVDEDSQRV